MQTSNAQNKNTIYKGFVFFPDSLTYPYTISLIDDSIPLLTKNFVSPEFTIQANQQTTNLVISSLGFEPVDIPIVGIVADTINLNRILFEETSLQLNEVVVTAKKAIIRNKGMNYSISNIRGSYIGNAGNLMDMLSWTPGISVTDDENISVLGRGGNPLIYVNGAKIMDKSQLHSLTSSNVDKIEIIREPGAEYPVGTSSVIFITTSKPIGEMVNCEVSENAIFRRKFSDKVKATTFGRVRRVSFNASLTYELNQGKQSSDYLLDVLSDTQASKNTQLFNQYRNVKNHSVLWFIGANYITKNKSTFLLQYSGTFGDNSDNYNTCRSIYSLSDTQDEQYMTYSDYAPVKHNVLGSGSMKVFGGMLKLTATYNNLTNITTDQFVMSDEQYLKSSEYKYRYNMLTFQGDYSHKIAKLGKHSFGFYLGYVDNFMNLDNSVNKESQVVNGNNKWAEAYYSLNVEINKFNIQGGLRGRYEYDTSTENASSKNALSYTNIAPKLSADYSISTDYILSASYARFYDLPTFSQINPAIRLSNLVFYAQGNQNLKQAYTNRFNITANIKKFTVIAEYYDCNHNIFNVTESYVNGTFLRHPENMNRTSDLLLAGEYTVMPNSSARIYGRVMGIRSNLQYVYDYELIKLASYTLELDCNAAYRLGAFSIFLNGRYNTPQRVDTRWLSYRFALNIGADCSLLKNKLYMRLEMQDIFNRSMTPSWKDYSPSLYQYRVNKYDTRGVSLTLRYKFTSAKTGFKQSSNSADANRLD
jgi:hypothetical protein